MNIKEIQELIRFVSKSGVSEVAIEQENFKITIKAGNTSFPAAFQGHGSMENVNNSISSKQNNASTGFSNQPSNNLNPINSGGQKSEITANSNLITIKSPMVGTFYRTAGPNKENFVNIGDEINPGKILCIIEAMKLFNDIESEISGKIVKVLVENASPVEYDQPLFLVEPI